MHKQKHWNPIILDRVDQRPYIWCHYRLRLPMPEGNEQFILKIIIC